MRTKDILVNGFEDIKILLQYLYMNKNHTITSIDAEKTFNKINTNL